MRRNATKSKGFTLVEMAIFLIAIAMVVGVVLSANSLIDSAIAKSVMQEFEDHRARIETFVEKYHALPGDIIDAEGIWGVSNTSNGSGNGIVSWVESPAEPLKAWEHLQLAGLIDLNGITATGSFAEVGVNVPLSSSDFGGYYISSTSNKNAIGLGATDGFRENNGPAVGVQTAFTIDKKIDDGEPLQGKLRGDGSDCRSGSRYDLEYDDIACTIVMIIEH